MIGTLEWYVEDERLRSQNFNKKFKQLEIVSKGIYQSDTRLNMVSIYQKFFSEQKKIRDMFLSDFIDCIKSSGEEANDKIAKCQSLFEKIEEMYEKELRGFSRRGWMAKKEERPLDHNLDSQRRRKMLKEEKRQIEKSLEFKEKLELVKNEKEAVDNEETHQDTTAKFEKSPELSKSSSKKNISPKNNSKEKAKKKKRVVKKKKLKKIRDQTQVDEKINEKPFIVKPPLRVNPKKIKPPLFVEQKSLDRLKEEALGESYFKRYLTEEEFPSGVEFICINHNQANKDKCFLIKTKDKSYYFGNSVYFSNKHGKFSLKSKEIKGDLKLFQNQKHAGVFYAFDKDGDVLRVSETSVRKKSERFKSQFKGAFIIGMVDKDVIFHHKGVVWSLNLKSDHPIPLVPSKDCENPEALSMVIIKKSRYVILAGLGRNAYKIDMVNREIERIDSISQVLASIEFEKTVLFKIGAFIQLNAKIKEEENYLMSIFLMSKTREGISFKKVYGGIFELKENQRIKDLLILKTDKAFDVKSSNLDLIDFESNASLKFAMIDNEFELIGQRDIKKDKMLVKLNSNPESLAFSHGKRGLVFFN